MKNKTLLVLLLFTFLAEVSFAQNANIGNKTCTVQKVNLPVNYTNPESRFYSLVTQGRFAYSLDKENKRLFGWEVDQEKPVVKAVVNLYGFTIRSPKKQSKKVEKKDEDGKVTSSYTEYWYTGSAAGRGTLYLYGHQDPFVYTSKKKKDKPPSKAELKRKEQEAAAQKKIDDNPFLSSEVKDEMATSDVDEDTGLEDSDLPLAKRLSVDQTKNLETKKFRSAIAAYKDYKDRIYPQLSDFRAAYPQIAFNRAVRTLNNQYGYAPSKNYFKVRTIKNKKHPESSLWGNAVDATVQIFKMARFNKTITKQQESLLPVIDYFVTQVERNSEDDKKQRKVKRAAIENLLNIYYYLDQHDAVIALASKFADSKKFAKFSNRYVEKSTRQKAHLAHLDMKTGHLNDETLEFDESEVFEVEEDTAEGQ